MDCSLPGSSVHGILQVRLLKCIAMSPPGDLPDPGIERASLRSPALAGGFFSTSATWEALYFYSNYGLFEYLLHTRFVLNTGKISSYLVVIPLGGSYNSLELM